MKASLAEDLGLELHRPGQVDQARNRAPGQWALSREIEAEFHAARSSKPEARHMATRANRCLLQCRHIPQPPRRHRRQRADAIATK